MDIKELERLELRERILKQMSLELYRKAVKIFYKSEMFEKWKKKHSIKSKWEGYVENLFFNSIKTIQMELLDQEVNDALKNK